MSPSLQLGGNTAIGAFAGTVIVTHDVDPQLDVNLTAFLLTDSGKVYGDSGIVYYNQPNGPQGVATFIPPQDSGSVRSHRINFNLQKAPTGITIIAVTLTEEKHLGFSAVKNLKAEIHSGGQVIQLLPNAFTTENGIIVLELYVRNGLSKVRAIWQGFSSGLDGLCKNYGVDVDESSAPSFSPSTQAMPTSSINLQKVSGSINLSKGQKPVLIEKTPEITASISWRSGTDYDVYALVFTKGGCQVDVATFGAEGVPPLMNYGNGAVVHMGDVGRDDGSDKTEIIKIRLNDDILAVVPVAYSAQSNGTGSFYHYQVSMLIDNNRGTTVTIPAKNASQENTVFSCVPGIIRNTPQGVIIDPVERYSRPGSEHRPKLVREKDGTIDVVMDAGPENEYK